MTETDWDDDRLAAAFHDRFHRPTPPTVALAIRGVIAGTTPARYQVLGRVPARNLAAAAVVVLLVGSVAVALAGFGRLGGGPSLPSDGTAIATLGDSVTPTADATDQALGSVLGLPIIDVSAAIAIRDGGADDRELAVRGWFTPTLTPALRCAAPRVPHISPVQLDCGDGSMWLTRDPESLIHRTGDQLSHAEPEGPAVRPYLDNVDQSWQPADFGIDANGDSKPTDVVFVGHFDDRRVTLCPEEQRAACRNRFVVDSVARAAGQAPPRILPRVDTVSALSDIEAIIDLEAPQARILSIVVTQYPEDLAAIEPSLAEGQAGLIDQPHLWIVRVLESEHAVTYIVIDGTDAIYEMTQAGDAVKVGGTTSETTATPGPWPPDNAVVVALTSPVGAGEPPVQVAVVDRSDRLISVTEKGAVAPSTPTFDGRFGAFAEPGMPGRVHLEWIGGICDSRITVTVAADLGTIVFDMGPQPANCDSIGVGRELVLDFDGSVDVPTIELRDAADDPTETEGRDYELDCGPFGPDTCEQKASDMIEANRKAHPERRVVSITFVDLCGSLDVMFDDGTGEGADADCFIPPPVASPPDYQLDCGPLDPEACQTRAVEIVAANLKRDPPKRVVSITITSLCGSYSAIFDDGTGSSANILCIPR